MLGDHPPPPSSAERWNAAWSRLLRRLVLVASELPGNLLERAAHEHGLSAAPATQEERDDHAALFLPWFLFTWTPTWPGEPPPGHEDGSSLAESHLVLHEEELDEDERLLIERTVLEPFSFYRVGGLDESHVELRDLLRRRDRRVLAPELVARLEEGQLLFARIVDVEDDLSLALACASQALPGELSRRILETAAALTPGALEDDELEADQDRWISLHRQLRHELTEAGMNSDGDPLVLHHLTFEVTDTDDAIEALASLTARGPDEIEDALEWDEHGELARAAVPWNRVDAEGRLQPRGQLELKGRRLTAEVDSASRADELRAALHVLLGEDCREVDCTRTHLAEFTRQLEDAD
ncbi:MAG: hypothetical protein AAF533_10625 [Acidobacteriota bacterium]